MLQEHPIILSILSEKYPEWLAAVKIKTLSYIQCSSRLAPVYRACLLCYSQRRQSALTYIQHKSPAGESYFRSSCVFYFKKNSSSLVLSPHIMSLYWDQNSNIWNKYLIHLCIFLGLEVNQNCSTDVWDKCFYISMNGVKSLQLQVPVLGCFANS